MTLTDIQREAIQSSIKRLETLIEIAGTNASHMEWRLSTEGKKYPEADYIQELKRKSAQARENVQIWEKHIEALKELLEEKADV